MDTITLGNKVVVSDPCYTIPTWCQAVIENVLPGEYVCYVQKAKKHFWGDRISKLIAIHSDYQNKNTWIPYPADIGVDSGQAGIFDFNTYRDDEYAKTIPHGDGEDLKIEDQSGDKWYCKMCSRTLGHTQYGSYPNGIVSSSGLGDGSYELFVLKHAGQIVGFKIDFGVDEEEDDEY